ncbi:cytochrome b [Acinetobacter soli]|uniref:cytochrome b n=1 Tax=Acinetobacter soli TaxID=487316 RepID=UPI0012600490|nr:cytochrome b [Acinetobacter soli]
MESQKKYYTKTAQWLHWIMALIFISAWIIGFYSGNFLSWETEGDLRGNMIDLHKNIATTLIFLIVIRICWRFTHPTPKLPDTMSFAMKRFAHFAHLALYLMLIALPITGCLYSWTAGHPAPVLYLFEIPRLVQPNHELSEFAHTIHVYVSWFASLLIVGHILAALKHHFIDKDDVLRSMTSQPND